jgi:membrane-anchored glycerophosphoryl diester phosphodiesterase (GDPDase)
MQIWLIQIAKSKTMIFSIILSVIGVIQASTDFLSTIMSPHAFGYLTLVIGIIAAILRVVTTQPLSDK